MNDILQQYIDFKNFLHGLEPDILKELESTKYSKDFYTEHYNYNSSSHSQTKYIKTYSFLGIGISASLTCTVINGDTVNSIGYSVWPIYKGLGLCDGSFDYIIYKLLISNGIEEKFPYVRLPKFSIVNDKTYHDV